MKHQQFDWLIDWFYIPFDTKYVILDTFLMEKLNLTQQKHTFTNEKKCTTTQNKQKTKARLSHLLQHPAWK